MGFGWTPPPGWFRRCAPYGRYTAAPHRRPWLLPRASDGERVLRRDQSRIAGRDRADESQALHEEVDRLEELEQVAVLEQDLAVHHRALGVVAVVQGLPVGVVQGQHVTGGQRLVRPDDPAVGDRPAAPADEQVGRA